MHPTLHHLWARCAKLQPMDYAKQRGAETAVARRAEEAVERAEVPSELEVMGRGWAEAVEWQCSRRGPTPWIPAVRNVVSHLYEALPNPSPATGPSPTRLALR